MNDTELRLAQALQHIKLLEQHIALLEEYQRVHPPFVLVPEGVRLVALNHTGETIPGGDK